jgi:hypothetical protein
MSLNWQNLFSSHITLGSRATAVMLRTLLRLQSCAGYLNVSSRRCSKMMLLHSLDVKEWRFS